MNMTKNRILCMLIILTTFGTCSCTSQKATLHFTGDIMLSRSVEPVLLKEGLQHPYESFNDLFTQDDLTVGNLECPITTANTPVLKRKIIIFKALPQNAKALKKAGFDLMTLANNHTMDYNEKGMADTLTHLQKAGLYINGADKTAEQANAPIFIKKQGIQLGFVSYSTFPAEGYIHNPKGFDVAHSNEKRMANVIKQAKKQCDVLIVSVHWGTEFQHRPSEQQQALAHELINAGADLIVGHHPHVIQGVEKYRGKYVFYSLGNFIFDRQIPSGTDEAFILKVDVQKNNQLTPSLTPVIIKNAQPKAAPTDMAKDMFENLAEYSPTKTAQWIKTEHGWIIEK